MSGGALPQIRDVFAETERGAYWRKLALCKGMDPEIFFPERGGDTATAKAICAACPAQRPCRAYGLEANPGHGIWGGLSEQERSQRRRRLRMAS